MTTPAVVRQTQSTFVTPQSVTTSTQTTASITSVHQLKVDGQANAVNYQDQGTAKSVAAASAQLTLEPGATYTLNAEGSINKGSGVHVSPTDPQRGRPNQTRLQIQLKRPDGSIESRNYSPGMEIRTGTRAGEVPPGTKLSTVFVDGKNGGEIRDNSGSYRVTIQQEEVKTATVNNTVVHVDGVDRPPPNNTGVVPPVIVPPPAAPAPETKALEVKDGQIKTSGGAVFEPKGTDALTVKNADGSSTTFDFKQGRLTESDGSAAVFDEALKKGIYNLPDGTQLRFQLDAAGNVTGYNVQSGDQLAKVSLPPGGPELTMTPDTKEGRAEAQAFRRANAADNTALNFHQVGAGKVADGIAGSENKHVGWYASRGNEALGWLEGSRNADGTLVNRLEGLPAYVDPALQPKLGTQGFEDALKNQLNNDLGAAAGHLERAGLDPAQAERLAAYYLAPERQQVEQARAWNQLIRENPAVRDWFGGWGNYFGSAPEGMEAVRAMYALLAQQQALAISPQQRFV